MDDVYPGALPAHPLILAWGWGKTEKLCLLSFVKLEQTPNLFIFSFLIFEVRRGGQIVLQIFLGHLKRSWQKLRFFRSLAFHSLGIRLGVEVHNISC